jgi:hypothetical protein
VQYAASGERLGEFSWRCATAGRLSRRHPAAGERRSERVEYRWSPVVTEWYVNRPDGVEHGLTLTAPPASGAAVLTFALQTDLLPTLDAGHGGLTFWDAGGARILHYAGLAVYDATGRALPASLSLAAVKPGAWQMELRLETAGAVYPLTVDPLLFSEVRILRASDAQAGDEYGYSVAISGDTLLVGAPFEDGGAGDPLNGAGAAYLFLRNTGGADHWGQAMILRASDAQAGDGFGTSVAISANTSDLVAGDQVAVVGAPGEDGGVGDPLSGSGAAYVFYRNQGGADNWGQLTILRASDAQVDDEFGQALATSAWVIAAGAPYEDGGAGDPASQAGAAYIFARNQGGADAWGQVQLLHTPVPVADTWFGYELSLSGATLVVGAPLEDGPGGAALSAGGAHVFERNQGGADAWGQVAALYASDFQAGDFFGWSLAINGDTVVAGAYGEDGGSGDPLTDAGAAYIFRRNQGGADAWGQVTILRAADAQAGDHLGQAVAISHDTIAAGAPFEDGGSGDPIADSGAAYVFQRNQAGADAWGQVQSLHSSEAQADDRMGEVLAISGETILAGARFEDGGPGDPLASAGAAYVFQRSGGIWQQIANPRASDAQATDLFANSVSLSGDTLLVGAHFEDGGSGNPLSNAGAAYIFTRNTGGLDGWGEAVILRAADAQASDLFGYSVSLSGDVAVIGAYQEDGGPGSPISNGGAAYIFTRNTGGAGNWGQLKVLYSSEAYANDSFGYAGHQRRHTGCQCPL